MFNKFKGLIIEDWTYKINEKNKKYFKNDITAYNLFKDKIKSDDLEMIKKNNVNLWNIWCSLPYSNYDKNKTKSNYYNIIKLLKLNTIEKEKIFWYSKSLSIDNHLLITDFYKINFPFYKYVKLVLANDANKLEISEVGLYSITRKKDQINLKNFIIDKIDNTDNLSITDVCGGNGFDALNLILNINFSKIIIYEINNDHYDIIRNNIEIYEKAFYKNAFNNKDICMNKFPEIILKKEYLIDEPINTDIVYIDPPWGGIDYKENLELKFLDLSIFELTKQIFIRNKCVKYIFWKLPKVEGLKIINNIDSNYFSYKKSHFSNVIFIEANKLNWLPILEDFYRQNQSKIIQYPNWNQYKAEDVIFNIKNKIILKKNIKNYGFYYKNNLNDSSRYFFINNRKLVYKLTPYLSHYLGNNVDIEKLLLNLSLDEYNYYHRDKKKCYNYIHNYEVIGDSEFNINDYINKKLMNIDSNYWLTGNVNINNEPEKIFLTSIYKIFGFYEIKNFENDYNIKLKLLFKIENFSKNKTINDLIKINLNKNKNIKCNNYFIVKLNNSENDVRELFNDIKINDNELELYGIICSKKKNNEKHITYLKNNIGFFEPINNNDEYFYNPVPIVTKGSGKLKIIQSRIKKSVIDKNGGIQNMWYKCDNEKTDPISISAIQKNLQNYSINILFYKKKNININNYYIPVGLKGDSYLTSIMQNFLNNEQFQSLFLNRNLSYFTEDKNANKLYTLLNEILIDN